jgi:hypothetical protein
VPVEENAHILELTAKSGKRLLLPAAGLPPPLNRGKFHPVSSNPSATST